jgi:hypothetical protein
VEFLEAGLMASVLRRMTDADVPLVLDLLGQTRGTKRTPATWRGDAMTALLLKSDAALPMSVRQFVVAPGRALNVGWISNNMFASRMGWRRQTRGTHPEWATLLPELDCLIAVKRDEPTLASRWYAQTGFHAVNALRCLYLDMPEPPATRPTRHAIAVLDAAQIGEWQGAMAAVHREAFAQFGGYRLRDENFYGNALATHYYGSHYQFQIIGLWQHGSAGKSLVGYAIVGWSGWHSKQPRMDLLELATRQWDAALAQELVDAACQIAWSKQVTQVRAVLSVHDPYRPHLLRTGFVDRWGYTMLAKWLAPQRAIDRWMLSERPTTDKGSGPPIQMDIRGELPLRIANPNTPTSIPPATRWQLDAAMCTRLLLNRLDISAAVADGSIISPDGQPLDPATLAARFPWTPWAFHMLDYI